MKRNQVWNNKIYWVIAVAVLVGVVILAIGFLTGEKEGLGKTITKEAYHSYDHYGFTYDRDEAVIYPMLSEMLPLKHFEVSLETENSIYYTDSILSDLQKVKALLPEAHYIRTIAFREGREGEEGLIRSYYINYLDKNGDRVNIEYYMDGLVIKTIGIIDEGKIVTVSNRMTKDVHYAKMLEENPIFQTEQWLMVAGKEFVSYDVWAGSGLYFQQVGNRAYCTLMIFGSGVAVAGHYTSLVSMDDQGLMHLQLPDHMSTGTLTETLGNPTELVEAVLSVEGEAVVLGDHIFEASDTTWGYDALQEMYESGWFVEEEAARETSVDSHVGLFQIGVTSPMSQYSPMMSSVPGLPIETSCEADAEADTFDIKYSAEHGSFIVWTDGHIKQMGKTCTVPFKNHTVYWSPLGDDFAEHLEWKEIGLNIEVVDQQSQKVLSAEQHKVYQQGGSFALDQLPMPTKHAGVIREGLAIYPVRYTSTLPFGDEGIAQPIKAVIDGHAIFTQDDLAYVNWEQQEWYFTDVYLAGIVKNWHFKSDSLVTVDTKKDDILSIGGADLLGNYHDFILVVDGESIYEGYFQPPLTSSFLPLGPVISDIGEVGIRIKLTANEGAMDPRYDERIKDVLTRYGLLK